MSTLSTFMHAAREILDEQDRIATNQAARKEQPPFLVRTTWLFAELAELALPAEAETFKAITLARLAGDLARIGLLIHLIDASEAEMPGRQRHERRQLCVWIREQIEREPRR